MAGAPAPTDSGMITSMLQHSQQQAGGGGATDGLFSLKSVFPAPTDAADGSSVDRFMTFNFGTSMKTTGLEVTGLPFFAGVFGSVLKVGSPLGKNPFGWQEKDLNSIQDPDGKLADATGAGGGESEGGQGQGKNMQQPSGDDQQKQGHGQEGQSAGQNQHSGAVGNGDGEAPGVPQGAQIPGGLPSGASGAPLHPYAHAGGHGNPGTGSHLNNATVGSGVGFGYAGAGSGGPGAVGTGSSDHGQGHGPVGAGSSGHDQAPAGVAFAPHDQAIPGTKPNGAAGAPADSSAAGAPQGSGAAGNGDGGATGAPEGAMIPGLSIQGVGAPAFNNSFVGGHGFVGSMGMFAHSVGAAQGYGYTGVGDGHSHGGNFSTIASSTPSVGSSAGHER